MANPGSILNFRIGSVLSIGGLIAATLFADTILACRWEGVKLPRSFWKLAGLLKLPPLARKFPNDFDRTSLTVGCCSPQLPGEIFRVVLVNFSRFFPRFQSALVDFSRFFPRLHSVFVNFSQFQSVLVIFKQII